MKLKASGPSLARALDFPLHSPFRGLSLRSLRGSPKPGSALTKEEPSWVSENVGEAEGAQRTGCRGWHGGLAWLSMDI